MTAIATTPVLPARPFEVCGPLPAAGATTVLEASAGTGKTYTIAALAARYVAEGVATLSELMLVTFGREATHELRERVRERLTATERALADPAAARAAADVVLRHLATGDDAAVAARRERLRLAVAEFDAATIATTHQFCQRMLAGLGVLGDADPDALFVESVDDLVEEVVDDFYVRKYATTGADRPAFGRDEALDLARAVVGDPQARIEPVDADAGSVAATRRSFAEAVRREVDRRRRAAKLFSYDDMLTRLDAALSDPVRGEAAAARLRSRYRVVLVDEFQDTDPVQWRILSAAFHGHTTLVLIGDPKQAIYAFRGADVVSYLQAAAGAGERFTLDTNYRSDRAVVRAVEAVFDEAALGDRDIVVHPVTAAEQGRTLRGSACDAPLRVRIVGTERLGRLFHGVGRVDAARPQVAADVAAQIAGLLAGAARIVPADGRERPVLPGDVAVLVRTNDQAELVNRALRDAGVPAVVTGTRSVFGTPVAADWLTLLEALEQPHSGLRLRAAALTCFAGVTVADLCGADADAVVESLGDDLRDWAGALRGRGVAALLEAVSERRRLAQRLLARTDGDRTLTDLRHIGQALHHAATREHLGPSALVEWLRRRIGEAGSDTGAERSRRLESDADAVQIVTVHRSKGQEYPIVAVPFAWDRNVQEPKLARLHEGADQQRVLDVGGPSGPRFLERQGVHLAEEAGEDLRLLYVALTRARSQILAWWVPATTTAKSSLHRMLAGGAGPGETPRETCAVPRDPGPMFTALVERAGRGPDGAPHVVVERVGDDVPAPWVPPAAAVPILGAAHFDREVDLDWRRTSYSALTAAAHDAGPQSPAVVSEPEEPGLADEPAPDPLSSVVDPVAARAVPSPMADLPMGTAFGTLVHSVFEAADTSVPDLRAELAARARVELARRPAAVDPDELAAALVPVARTPLGPLVGGATLADVAPADRLSELDFELPLAGGDRPGPSPVLADVARLLRAHLPADDPLAGYPDHLDAPLLADQPLRGYLTGSIDAVLRVGGRYVIVDYKTNWLGPVGPEGHVPLTSAHYGPAALTNAMTAAHYPLQALLYAVALHRYLRWRLPGYDPATHLGGALYLFLRGMCGPGTPAVDGVPAGVFSWAPPPALVTDLSRLLDEGTA
ncbi:UvrD-helicase domain-containing protein [Pseudonocardia sp. N23]|uniref:UvrD-helicase domain-containing protein n=1 Tax=Pseudonocardia sp. N23 TaxID=1987376 RepID=UPI000BFEA7EC|nr:UvrD-helicase domain-containing protein [Pseudonocardia sp. N23]GAY07783.1 exodeoxyribonuclease V beta chain [Pseudonocardia sp. N23]